jgi:hypothetical protein
MVSEGKTEDENGGYSSSGAGRWLPDFFGLIDSIKRRQMADGGFNSSGCRPAAKPHRPSCDLVGMRDVSVVGLTPHEVTIFVLQASAGESGSGCVFGPSAPS